MLPLLPETGKKEGEKRKMTDSYICLDIETTGLNPKTDKIIEIGAIKVMKGRKCKTFTTFINPGRKLNERITELTGIENGDLQDAPDISQIIADFLEFAEELPLLGHSILFDYSFIKKAAVNQKLTFEREAIDTLKIARCYLPELPSKRLGSLCEYYGIPLKAHRALEDAAATDMLYRRLREDFGEREEGALFRPQRLIYQAKKDSPITRSQKERLYRLIRQYELEIDYEVEKLTKSEASRYTDQILSSKSL